VRIGNAPSSNDGSPVKGHRPALFKEEAGFVDTPVFDRYALPTGFELRGPAIIEEREATTVVLPGTRMRVDELLQLRIQIMGGTDA